MSAHPMIGGTASIESTRRITRLIRDVRSKGVRLWPENGQLRCEAPRGALTRDELEGLKTSKGEIIALLQHATKVHGVPSNPVRREPADRVPLTLSQVLHWHAIRSRQRPCQRATASAMRVSGSLDLALLRQSLARLVRRHESLRTRIVVVNGEPTQQLADDTELDLEVVDVSHDGPTVAKHRVGQLIADCIRQQIDLAADSLFLFKIFKLGEDEHVVMVAMEHIIADGWSLGLLWRDLFTLYDEAAREVPSTLPEIPVQYADFAVWQAKAYRLWMNRHGAQWNARMKGARTAQFPVDESVPTPAPRGWATIPIHCDEALTTAWRKWCRHTGATLPMSAFTAYAALVLRWCGTSEAVFQYQTTGRLTPKVENTVGLFASVLYLRIATAESDTLRDLSNYVTAEYCRAYAAPELGYMAAQVPRPELSRATAFNWIPQSRASSSYGAGTPNPITLEPMEFSNPVVEGLQIEGDPSIAFLETDQGVTGSIHLPLDRFSTDTLERFGRNFVIILKALLRQPEARLKDIPLV